MQMNRRELVIGTAAAAIVAPTLAMALPTPVEPFDLRSVSINWPHMLASVLKSKHHIAILPMHVRKPDGWKLGHVRGDWYQLHIPTDDPRPSYGTLAFRSGHVIALAQAIAYRSRRTMAVRFAPLWLPPAGKGVVTATEIVDSDISVRIITAHDVRTDDNLSRMDVLFEVT